MINESSRTPKPDDGGTDSLLSSSIDARRTLHRLRRRARRSAFMWRQRLAFFIGAGCVGLAAVLFAQGSDFAFEVFNQMLDRYPCWPWLVTPLTFALLIWSTEGVLRATRGSGIPQVIVTIGRPEREFRERMLSLPVAVGKMALTLFALLGGASVGREGPTVHVGAALMYNIGSRFELFGRRTVNGLILAGGAAGIAAAFNTPLAGVMFAIEELSHTFEQRFSGLVLSAVMFGGVVSLGIIGNYTYFGSVYAQLDFGPAWLAVLACGLGGGLAGGIYSRVILLTVTGMPKPFGNWRRNHPVMFAFACGVLLAAVGAASGNQVFGTGYEQARSILQGVPDGDGLFGLWKLLANILSYIAGIPGGFFSPSLAVGAGIGQWIAPLIPGASFASVALLGMSAYLAGVTQAPLTAIVISLELTDGHALVLPVIAACLLARACSALVCRVPVYKAFAFYLFDSSRK